MFYGGAESGSADEDMCPICMDKLTDKEVVELPCKHNFHKECILNMVMSKEIDSELKCPICRQPFDRSVVIIETEITDENIRDRKSVV